MIKKHVANNVVWVDIESPTKEDVRLMMDEYNIHPLIANEMLSPTLRPRVDVYDHHMYLILHIPNIIVRSLDKKQEQEVDFIIGKNFIITVHYEPIEVLAEFSKLFESGTLLNKYKMIEMHAGFLFFHMVRHIYSAINKKLDSISQALVDIENNIFTGQEHDMVVEISKTGRQLLNMKRWLSPNDDILESFKEASRQLFGEDFSYYSNAILGIHSRVSGHLKNDVDTLTELRSTNDSLLNTKTNDVMKVLTIMAFVTFPLMLVSSLFGMNTVYLPIVGHQYDFWIIVGFMAASTISFFSFFKYKKWL